MDDATAAATTRQAAVEAGKILDALTVLGHDIACDEAMPGEQLVLPAAKVREVCGAIHEAVAALKRLLEVTHERGATHASRDDRR
jgi:hypothetical protein